MVNQVIAGMPSVSRALSKGDPAEAYWLLRDVLPVGPAGFALLELVRTVPDWDERVLRRFPQERKWRRPGGPVARPQHRAKFDSPITDAEFPVLVLIAEGLTDGQIGETLGKSALTVKQQVMTMLDRLGASNRAHLVGEAFRRGLLV